MAGEIGDADCQGGQHRCIIKSHVFDRSNGGLRGCISSHRSGLDQIECYLQAA
jgi:hypothetical protein